MSARPGPRALAIAFVALLALAGASFALSFAHLGRMGVVAALVVAAAKATIVIVVFMELASEPASSQLAVGAALATVAILVGLVIADVSTREPAALAPPSIPDLPGAGIPVGPSRRVTEGPAKTSAGNGEGALRP